MKVVFVSQASVRQYYVNFTWLSLNNVTISTAMNKNLLFLLLLQAMHSFMKFEHL